MILATASFLLYCWALARDFTGDLLKCRIVQVVWQWLRQRRDNIVHGRRIGRALIGSSRFVARTYAGRRALLPV
ncbi:hypothetical protein Acr_00g0078940 [Actinidia rufa]|uniref:Secreted protein n=1 Tax=Actinidia rufa TaxID=165716 RepID=A0A7J0DU00_9ERIC|nr:hypothetical protein Acr_00g0078940 [Actinidia rufa]